VSAPPKQQTIPASAPHVPVSAPGPSVCPQGRQPGRREPGLGAAPAPCALRPEDPVPTLASPTVL